MDDLFKTPMTDEFLNISIEELNLPIRAYNGLVSAGLKTVADILDYGLHKLEKKRNIGEKSIDIIKNTILEIQNSQTNATSEISFKDAINIIFSSVTPKYLPMMEKRFGYDGKCKTLEAIGKEIGITRERVRQIIEKEIRRIRHPKRKDAVQTLIENIERLLFRYKGILSINDIAKDVFFDNGTHKQVRFLISLFSELYEERYRIVDKYFLTSLSDNEINTFQFNIREAALQCKFPIDEKTLMENIQSLVGFVSKDYLSYHLLYRERLEISKGQVLSLGRLSIPQRVKLVIKDIDKPMHFSEIAKLYKTHFSDSTAKTSTLEHAIHTRISNSNDFIIVNPGTFMLRSKFIIPDNIKQIVKTSRDILHSMKNISDTKFILNELKKRDIDVGSLNAYSLKSVLLEYSGFISYRKFEVGIEDLADQYERKPLADLIYEILQSASKPMHVKNIWKEIQKQRGFPEYSIDQCLNKNAMFIKVATATYTVKEKIPMFEEKRKIIISFAKEWINLKKIAVSAFFISEVLREAKEIKDLFLGLVDHVLETNREFVKLPNKFYDLAEKQT